eukprot:TRINITY_DN2634_c0_g1::TRINITY_DN2634_c0_g1_i1::g.25939::m.25939 TRINITY_DN2634_c0_g1::TRINITY_DN2634_c0_g1_i1::g.25939  ORF type:complete len:105 (-),score=-5.50,Ribosomal_L29e/PF01779.12/0.084 TRINITY_DN2634_c0_g1_i1:816-1130(-)
MRSQGMARGTRGGANCAQTHRNGIHKADEVPPEHHQAVPGYAAQDTHDRAHVCAEGRRGCHLQAGSCDVLCHELANHAHGGYVAVLLVVYHLLRCAQGGPVQGR